MMGGNYETRLLKSGKSYILAAAAEEQKTILLNLLFTKFEELKNCILAAAKSTY